MESFCGRTCDREGCEGLYPCHDCHGWDKCENCFDLIRPKIIDFDTVYLKPGESSSLPTVTSDSSHKEMLVPPTKFLLHKHTLFTKEDGIDAYQRIGFALLVYVIEAWFVWAFPMYKVVSVTPSSVSGFVEVEVTREYMLRHLVQLWEDLLRSNNFAFTFSRDDMITTSNINFKTYSLITDALRNLRKKRQTVFRSTRDLLWYTVFGQDGESKLAWGAAISNLPCKLCSRVPIKEWAKITETKENVCTLPRVASDHADFERVELWNAFMKEAVALTEKFNGRDWEFQYQDV